jgi:hypothetical protein
MNGMSECDLLLDAYRSGKLSPDEAEQFRQLLGQLPGRPTPRQVVETLPLSVVRKIMAAMDAKAEQTGRQERLYHVDDLDLHSDLKEKIIETFRTGTWTGDPDPERFVATTSAPANVEPAKTTEPEAAEKPGRHLAAERWVAAENADRTYDHWRYAVAK